MGSALVTRRQGHAPGFLGLQQPRFEHVHLPFPHARCHAEHPASLHCLAVLCAQPAGLWRVLVLWPCVLLVLICWLLFLVLALLVLLLFLFLVLRFGGDQNHGNGAADRMGAA